MWETVPSSGGSTIRRMAVPGGWLYQVEYYSVTESSEYGAAHSTTRGWHRPVFVPDVTVSRARMTGAVR